MELGGPLQYERFQALQGFGHRHGVVDYTNWEFAEPGSGVYAPQQGAHALVFTFGGAQYDHTLNGGLHLAALSPQTLQFRGNGAWNDQAGATWKIRGVIRGHWLVAKIVYDGTYNHGYRLLLHGKIAPNGTVVGTAKSSQGQVLRFAMPAGSFVSVLHYVAPIQADKIQKHNATFQFTIPKGSLAGTKVTVKVHDGGFGPSGDRYAHGVTGQTLSPYPIIGGPGVTVRR